MKYKHFAQKGFTLVELLITVAMIGVLSAILLGTSMKKNNEGKTQESRNAEINYNDYTRKCLNGHMYMASKSGDLRQLLSENKEPIVCEDKESNISNVEVNANPYNKTE